MTATHSRLQQACPRCGRTDVLVAFVDLLEERRTVWLCDRCEALARDWQRAVIGGLMTDEPIREPEASYR